MAAERNLPTVEEIFAGTTGELRVAYKALGDAADRLPEDAPRLWDLLIAYKALGDAADRLRSDWRPLGSSLTDAQAAARTEVYHQIDQAKRAIKLARATIEGMR